MQKQQLSDAWPLPEEFRTRDGAVAWARHGSGPSLVLTHGSPFSSIVWRDVLPTLAESHTVYVWDLLGYGQSEQRDGQDVSIAAQGRILADLVRHWDLDRPRILGHDFGGAISLRGLLFEGVPARDLVLLDAVGGGAWGTGFFRLIRENANVFSQLPDYAHEALIRSHVERATHHGLDPQTIESFLEPWRGTPGQASFYRQFAQARETQTDEVADHLGDVDVPTRILWGRQDQLLTEEFADLLRRGIPHAEFTWVDDAGHLVQIDAPQAVVEAVGQPRPEN